MIIIRSIAKMQAYCRLAIKQKKTIGFVPTMGALHVGHLSLIRAARKKNDYVVVSIFVNPAQFGPGEDLKKYPRNFKADSRLCQKEGVDVIFYPSTEEMYKKGHKVYIEVKDLDKGLCAKYRPGHFRGVATVVIKLFNIVSCDDAYFGQKDIQQARIISALVRDLNFPLNVNILPTVREIDGLALSSRNAYLTSSERADAPVLFDSLEQARCLIKNGQRDAGKIIYKIKEMISGKESAKVQYVEIVDADTLEPLKKIKGKVLIALAVFIGKTRLIDNIIVNAKTS